MQLLCNQQLSANAFLHAKSPYIIWPSLRLDTDQVTSRATGPHLIAASGLESLCAELLDFLLDTKLPSTNSKDDGRRTPIIRAAHHGHLEIVKLLAQAHNGPFGPSYCAGIEHPIFKMNNLGQNALHFAARSGRAR
jgi:ankyrin repeat protein